MLKSLLFVLAASVVSGQQTPVESSDPTLFAPNAQWMQIGGGYAGCEGTQWIGDTLHYAAHHDRLAFKWTVAGGLETWRDDSPEATSFRPDGRGGFYVVEQTTRRLTHWNADGQMIEVLADKFEGKRLNRPNDCRVVQDGSVWFTDPDFLFKKRPEETKELEGQYVFRYDPSTGKLTAPIRHLRLPNGIAISPDGRFLLVGDSSTEHVFRFAMNPDGTAGASAIFVTIAEKGIDGLAFDAKGRLWCCAKTGIHIFRPDGTKQAFINTPGKPTSIDFGPDGLLALTTTDAAYITRLDR